ncbi:hypothetical protein BDV32DRAFT_127193 [Aspergillus pseudonomiae]|nr:hypothetical protein BDV32DRAFT_127193 [Aspergillus pseudonomiae]
MRTSSFWVPTSAGFRTIAFILMTSSLAEGFVCGALPMTLLGDCLTMPQNAQ